MRWRVEHLDAPLRRRALTEEALEDPAGDPHAALIWPQDHGELRGISLIIPASIFRELEEQHLLTSYAKEQNVLIAFSSVEGG
jgi:hypothetical protein